MSVYWAVRINVLTWLSGLINQILFFGIFYQVQLYSDMWLQIFFTVMTIYGWLSWSKGKLSQDLAVYYLGRQQRVAQLLIIAILTVSLAQIMSELHLILPQYFPKPARFLYADAFTASASIVATFLLARKFIENWVLWIAVDVVSVVLYYVRGIPFMAMLYLVFLALATTGYFAWRKKI